MNVAKENYKVFCSICVSEYGNFFLSNLFDENKKKVNHVNQNMCILFEKKEKARENNF